MILGEVVTGVLGNAVYDVIKKVLLTYTADGIYADLLKKTKISIAYKNNYLDYALGLVDKNNFFFDISITNRSEFIQNFAIEAHYENLNGGISGPFIGYENGLNVNFSFLGNLYNLSPNNQQGVKLGSTDILSKLSGDEIHSLNDANTKMNFGLTDLEFKQFLTVDNRTVQQTLFLSQYLPAIPDNNPFIGVGFALRIRFIIGDWQVSRFLYGGFGYKDDIEKLKDFVQNNCISSNFTFFHLSNLLSTEIVLLENNQTNEKYIILEENGCYCSGSNVNEQLFSNLQGQAQYLHIFNKSTRGCITPITVFTANTVGQKVDFPVGFW